MRLISLLRSRRLAVALLVAMLAYAWVATLVPSATADPAASVAWDARYPVLGLLAGVLGLHRAYSSPLFLVAALLLTLSTTACAWERTRSAWRVWRSRGTASETTLRRVVSSPTCVLSAVGDRETVLAASTAALSDLGLRTRRGPETVEASSGMWALLGSPLFHWALVGTFVLAAAGQLTQYEGFANLTVGQTIQDSPTGYTAALSAGPWAGSRFTGVGIRVRDLVEQHVVDGIDRGASPFVEIVQGDRVVASQWSYPNNPLSWGPLVVHMRKDGPAFVGTVRYPTTGASRRVVLYYDVDAPLGASLAFPLPDASGPTSSAVRVARVKGQRVEVKEYDGSAGSSQTVGVGETATLHEGITLSVDELTGYAQIKVVNDWTVPWIFTMFTLGTIGAGLAASFPVRRVWMLYAQAGSSAGDDDVPSLRVLVTGSRRDPAFPRRVEAALRARVLPAEPAGQEES
ncbi:MAG TPA: cytochrome c biogenesis protein ResB [Coriobacteriia bacterium]